VIDARVEKHAVLNAPKKFQKKLKAQIKNGITAATLMRSRYFDIHKARGGYCT
jgi:hypothetical protein